ncbi:MAG: hypothetical protein BGO95_06870 [Micrococcales bacterium 73-13]|nr:MAG: hypothetical protein BGO95_06870 [Micrococcales bacterium 73-13]
MAHIIENARDGGTTYTVRWRDGGRFRQRSFTVKREAERFQLRIESQLEEGTSTAALVRSGKTFRQVAEDMIATTHHKLKRTTAQSEVGTLRKHVYPTFGARKVSTITMHEVEDWIAKLATEPRSPRPSKANPHPEPSAPLHPSSVKQAYLALHKVLKYAMRHRLIGHDPAQGVALPRVTHEQRFEPDFLTAQEVDALVARLAGAYPADLFVELAAYTGLRAGEMLGLQVRDVNLMRRTLRVERTLQFVKGGWVEDTPKSEKSIRTVPLRRALVERLTAYLAQHPRRDEPQAPLWPGRNYAGGGEWRGGLDYGKRMDYASFYRNRFAPAAAALGHPGLRFHDLRHTAASLFAASGMPLARVSRILGHADTTITYKVYLGFFPDDFQQDMDRLDAYLAPTAAPVQDVVELPFRREA